MDDNTAAMVAGHMFTKLTGVKVDNQHCSGYDHEEQTWVGVINEYFWTVEKYDNEYLVSFSDEKQSGPKLALVEYPESKPDDQQISASRLGKEKSSVTLSQLLRTEKSINNRIKSLPDRLCQLLIGSQRCIGLSHQHFSINR